VASAVYLINDLIDLPHDRSHPRKRGRPLAAGVLPLQFGIVAAPVLFRGGHRRGRCAVAVVRE